MVLPFLTGGRERHFGMAGRKRQGEKGEAKLREM